MQYIVLLKNTTLNYRVDYQYNNFKLAYELRYNILKSSSKNRMKALDFEHFMWRNQQKAKVFHILTAMFLFGRAFELFKSHL